jgi:hypothetical protein
MNTAPRKPTRRGRRAPRLLAAATAAVLALVLVGAQTTLVAAGEDPEIPAAETQPVAETTAPPKEPTETEPVEEEAVEETPVEESVEEDANSKPAQEDTEVSDPTTHGSTDPTETDRPKEASRLVSQKAGNGDNVCTPLDGKWEVTQGAWDGSAAPGITGIGASGDQSITFTVASGYQLTSICVKTGNGVNQGDWSVSPSLPVTGPAAVTVTSSGGQGAGLSHISFDTGTAPTPQDSYVLSVTKLWDPLEGTTSSTPPDDLAEGFQLLLSGQGQNTMSCSYAQGSLSCTGNLVVADGETVGVTENAEGWSGPAQAAASCQSSQNQTGGTDTSCSISITNVQDPDPVNTYRLVVTKQWVPLEGGSTTSEPVSLSTGFQIDLSGQGQNTGTMSCSYAQGSLSCTGNLVVADGETVGVTENAEGWDGPSQATASCLDSQNQTGGVDRLCSIGVTNVAEEVEDPQDSYRLTVTKQWLPVGGEATIAHPSDLPPGFQLHLSGQGQNTGTLSCSYDQGSLSCTGDLVVADGETVGVTENAAGWDGPSQATASCQSGTNQSGGTDTFCSIGVTNIEEEVLGSTTQPLAPISLTDPGDPEDPGDPALPQAADPAAPSLAFTGTDLVRYAIVALSLLLAGLGLLTEARRRNDLPPN